MKNKIVASSRMELFGIIRKEIKDNGLNCDLNHIDVSTVRTMESLFSVTETIEFNGDISQWDVSSVENMYRMFKGSSFNGDISKWNVSKVKNMEEMFYKSQFNCDISEWNVSNIANMGSMFAYAKFSGDISKWDVSKVRSMNTMLFESNINCDLSDWKPYELYISKSFPIGKEFNPYWAKYDDEKERKKAIDTYWLEKELQKELNNVNQHRNKLKI
jgi:surface protein